MILEFLFKVLVYAVLYFCITMPLFIIIHRVLVGSDVDRKWRR